MRGAVRARWAACVLSGALAATAAGCGSGGHDEPGLVRASWSDPQNQLEPANTNEVQGGKVLYMIFRGLKRYDPRTGAAENMLAEKIDTTDQQNFTITLKDGWTFSNGEKITSRSFVDAWNYAALADNKQKNASFFEYLDGYDKVHPDSGEPTARTLSGLAVKDDRTFTARLRTKFSTWPDTLGYTAYSPLPRAFFDDHAAWLKKPVGNGPYGIDSYHRGSAMRLRRWDGYPGEDKARNDGVELRVYTDNNTAYTDLQAGNLDLVDDIPSAQLKNVRKDLGDRYINQPAGIIQTLAFPMYDERWSASGMEKVRRGLSMAINRDQITDQIYRKTRTPATDWTSPALGDQGGYKGGLCGGACRYDVAGAKSLIEEGGGLPGGRVTLTSNVDTGSHRVWMDAVCNSINNALGKDRACTVNPIGTFADFRNQQTEQRLTGPFRSGWQMDYPLIQNFLQPLYYTDASSNYGKFSDPQFDKLVDEANAESSQDKANAKFQEAERILAQQMPAIPLWYQNGSAGYSSRISDVTLNPFSVPVYEQIKIG
ncbi:peptide ABC transporter substrate-binding protein [Streptomyces eurocidicus]|uniref:ABC-type oligopeptide transport system substrate-binding subunit n=1 Tax=Streptomyces eurocidicus TaxID=66423 RepID=A0A2N8NRK3_STREU|nr:ABC transporter substrate-binding protein [Streptomyces eurocidicus]MBB5117211.1 ABC-type oligopeptide transport system substrate-binding subunit [Streptomyces eurocidicus]MBF6052497.1 ABC transporter substrate-binding protein [Streptomyces eurocidicus]PNE31390.1 peptide ABC transporter substrate-binding protein [Streptomyces eurocidicus]